MATSMRKLPLSILLKTNGSQLCRRSHRCQKILQTASSAVGMKESGIPVKQSSGIEQIVFPRRKKRDALSVLKCLAATVQKDPTAPDYFFIDDPYLYPDTKNSKKEFAMSKSAGRKAARYFVNNYPEIFKASLFNEEAAVPAIPEFMPKKINYEYLEPSEEALVERIEMRKVKDAMEIYEEIKEQGLELSQETRLSLLHLLCIFNSQDPKDEGNPEELRYHKLNKSPRQYTNTWKKDSAAEQVFADLQEKSSEAYCSLIRGMAKHLHAEQAFCLYEEALNKKLQIDVGTFNDLILLCRYQFTTDNEAHWNKMVEILNTMKSQKVAPNAKTFLFMCISLKACKRLQDKYLFHILNEMKVLNIEPPLGMYFAVIEILYREKSKTPDHPFLSQVLDYLQNKPIEFQTVEDVNFFISAMAAGTRRLYDLTVAHKLVDLVQSKDNEKFLIDLESEASFWHKYFMLVCELEGMDKIMEIYERIVPNRWSPSFHVYTELFRAVELYEGYHYLPQIKADMTLYRFTMPSITTTFFELLAKKKHPEELQNKFLEMIEGEVKTFHMRQQLSPPLSNNLSGDILGYFIVTCLHVNRLDLALEYLDLFTHHRKVLEGNISSKAIEMLIDECIKQNDKTKALECLEFMTGERFPKLKEYEKKVKEMIQKEQEESVS